MTFDLLLNRPERNHENQDYILPEKYYIHLVQLCQRVSRHNLGNLLVLLL